MIFHARAWYVRLAIFLLRFVPSELVASARFEHARVGDDTTSFVRLVHSKTKHQMVVSLPDSPENTYQMHTIPNAFGYEKIKVSLAYTFIDNTEARYWLVEGTRSELDHCLEQLGYFAPAWFKEMVNIKEPAPIRE